MAVAIDATSGSSTVTASSATLAHTCAASAVLYVFVYASPGSTVSGVTYNGVAMTRILNGTGGNDGTVMQCWRLATPASGAHNIVVTMSASTAEIDVIGVSVTGAAGTESNAATGNSSFTSGSPNDSTFSVSSAVGALALGAIGINMGITGGVTTNAGTERGAQDSTHRSIVVASVPGAATSTFDFTTSVAQWSTGLLKFSIDALVPKTSSGFFNLVQKA